MDQVHVPYPKVVVTRNAGQPYAVLLSDDAGRLIATITFVTKNDDAEMSCSKTLAYAYYDWKTGAKNGDKV